MPLGQKGAMPLKGKSKEYFCTHLQVSNLDDLFATSSLEWSSVKGLYCDLGPISQLSNPVCLRA